MPAILALKLIEGLALLWKSDDSSSKTPVLL